MELAAITIENELFFRTCQLLMGVGVKAMRQAFERLHHPKTLTSVLQSNERTLRKLPRRVLTENMQNTLFPSSNSYGKLSDFDITLLSVLFRHISGLKPPIADPVTGRRSWDEDPANCDVSLEADLVRLKRFRNSIYAHAKSTAMSSCEFAATWDAIADVLKRLDPLLKTEIDNLKTSPFTKVEITYNIELQNWYLHEQDVLKQLEYHGQDIKEELKSNCQKIIDKLEEVEVSKGLAQANKQGNFVQ